MTRSLHYNGSKTFLFANATKIYQFKVKNSEIKPYPLCVGNISNYFTASNMKRKRKKKTVLNGYVYDFSVDHNIIDTSSIINVHVLYEKNMI